MSRYKFFNTPRLVKEALYKCESAFEAIKSHQLSYEPSKLINKKFWRSLYFANGLSNIEEITNDDMEAYVSWVWT